MTVPCGQCIGCRVEKSRQWAVRIMHEAQLHQDNRFITLTYSPEHLPPLGSLRLRDFQLFMKRLRRRTGEKIRFFHCGEYGDDLGRPHYHACLFGYAFPDETPHRVSDSGHTQFRSDLLSDLWPLGLHEIGELTFESAQYVAAYTTKKIKLSHASTEEAINAYRERYEVGVDESTGEVLELAPEYATMSRNPGIARDWYDRYSADVFPHDHVIVNGHPAKPPRYYLEQLKKHDERSARAVKKARQLAADKVTRERLADIEECAFAKLTHKREFDA